MVKPNSPLTNEAVRKVAAHPSESGHWYDEHAQQILEVTGSKGQPVKPTLHHARKYQFCRGVTSTTEVPRSPQLELWGKRQAIMAALTLPRRESESEKDWLDRVEEDMEATAKAAREAGSSIDAAISASINGEPFDQAYARHIAGAMRAADALCGPQAWRAQVAVVSSLGFATKIDALSDEWVVNWKSKDGDQAALDKLELYDNQYMQLAAELAAAGGSRRAAIGYVSRDFPGAARLIEAERPKLERGWAMFLPLLHYTFAKDNYRPAWARD